MCLVLSGATASADEAISHRQRGSELYRNSEFRAAASQFKQAYRKQRQPELLFAWAQSERRAGNCKLARRLYRQFLSDAQARKDARAARAGLARCRAALKRASKSRRIDAETTRRNSIADREAAEMDEEVWTETLDDGPDDEATGEPDSPTGSLSTGTPPSGAGAIAAADGRARPVATAEPDAVTQNAALHAPSSPASLSQHDDNQTAVGQPPTRLPAAGVPSDRQLWYQDAGGAILVGGGIMLSVVGLGLYRSADGDLKDQADSGATHDVRTAAEDERTQRRIGGLFVGGLGVAAITLGVLRYRTARAEQRRAVLEGLPGITLTARWSKRWGRTRSKVEEDTEWEGLLAV
ncbi:MAG: hypothetical protein AAGC55_27435, partial [Myxococcota bacterium]